MSWGQRGRWILAGLLVLAFTVRVGAIAATPHLALAADPSEYTRHARSIAAGDGYPPSLLPAGGPTAIRPPGFPTLLAGIYVISGDSVSAARVAQALIGTLIVLLIALVGRELFGRTAGLVAAGLAAVFPPLVIDGMTLLSEPLFVVFQLAAVLAALRWRRSRALGWVAASGALVGAAMLTRSTGVLLLLPLALGVRGAGWRTLTSYRAPTLLVACALLVVAPWTMRNAVEMKAFILVSDQGGFTLAGTYNATSQRMAGFWLPPNVDPAMARLLGQKSTLREAALSNALGSAARHFALDHPGYVATVAWHNTRRLWNLAGTNYELQVAQGDYGLGRNWAKLMTYGLFPFVLLAVGGAFTRAARRAPLWVWGVPAVMFSTILVEASNRFRAPIDPFILMLGALGLIAVLRNMPRPATSRRTVTTRASA